MESDRAIDGLRSGSAGRGSGRRAITDRRRVGRFGFPCFRVGVVVGVLIFADRLADPLMTGV
jgi:hypothetical protein